MKEGTSGFVPDLKLFNSATPYIRRRIVWKPFNTVAYAVKVALGLDTSKLFTYASTTTLHPSGETTYEFRSSTGSPLKG